MRRAVLAAGVLCAVGLTGRGTAQNSSPAAGAAMPGRVVGSYSGQVKPVGQQAPAAAPQAGQSVTANAMRRPYDPSRPYDALKGTGLDADSLVAPLVGPDGKPVGQPDALDRLSEKIKAFFTPTAAPPRPPYVPSIGRRTRERNDHMWRRD
ncbi:MAG: hypothetical protein ACKODX_07310 [Gemmata sp.]